MLVCVSSCLWQALLHAQIMHLRRWEKAAGRGEGGWGNEVGQGAAGTDMISSESICNQTRYPSSPNAVISPLQVEVWPPAAPRFVSMSPSTTPSAPPPPDRQADTAGRASNIIYEDGSPPNHRAHSRAFTEDSAGRPRSATPASPLPAASVANDSNAGVGYHRSDGLAAPDKPHNTEVQDEGTMHSSQQRDARADAGSPLPVSARAGLDGRSSKQAGATVDAVTEGVASAKWTSETDEAKHQQQPQQQQTPCRSSSSRAAGNDTSPDKHIGKLF